MNRADEKILFQLNLQDLTFLFASLAITLLTTTELISPKYGRVVIFISKRKLRNAAIFASILFLITSMLKVIEIAIT
jgi:hypothetical protein